jgi:hypothetical protein
VDVTETMDADSTDMPEVDGSETATGETDLPDIAETAL